MDLQLQKLNFTNIQQRTIGIIGQKGSGKTITMILLWRECRKKKIASVFFDTLNIIRYKNKVVIRKWPDDETKKKMADTAIKLIEKTIEKNGSIVISFKNLVPSEIQAVCNAIFEDLHLRNTIVFFDEIHDYAPEFLKGGVEIERFIRHCRNNNNGVVFNTQRPAAVKKAIFALCDCLLVGRVMWIRDLKIISEMLQNAGDKKEKIEEIIKEIQELKTFEGVKIDFL